MHDRALVMKSNPLAGVEVSHALFTKRLFRTNNVKRQNHVVHGNYVGKNSEPVISNEAEGKKQRMVKCAIRFRMCKRTIASSKYQFTRH